MCTPTVGRSLSMEDYIECNELDGKSLVIKNNKRVLAPASFYALCVPNKLVILAGIRTEVEL